jgi:hypothetical protein
VGTLEAALKERDAALAESTAEWQAARAALEAELAAERVGRAEDVATLTAARDEMMTQFTVGTDICCSPLVDYACPLFSSI